MSSEIQANYTTGLTLYAQARNSVGQIWNGSAFEAYQTANIATYVIAMTEQGSASGYYTGNFPAVVAGIYNVTLKRRVGGSAAESDPTIADGEIWWNGTAVRILADNRDGDSLATAVDLGSTTPAVAARDLLFWFEPSIGGAYQDAAGTTPATADTDPIGFLPDLSGNGYNATQSTSGNRPLLKTTAFNGNACARFDGSNDSLSLGNPTALSGAAGGAYTVTYCVQLTSTPTLATLLSRGIDGVDVWDWLGNYTAGGTTPPYGVGFGLRVASSPQTGAIVSGNRYVISHRVTPTYAAPGIWGSYLHELFVNGRLIGTHVHPVVVTGTSWSIGARNDGSFYLPGDVAGISFYGASLTDVELAVVEAYFGNKYAVSLSRSVVRRPDPSLNLLIDGNSIPAGYQSQGSFYAQARPSLAYAHTVHLAAADGSKTSENTTRLPDHLTPFFDAAKLNVVVHWEITNEINAGVSAATAYANVVSYCNAVKAGNPSARIIVMTPLSRNFGANQTAYEANRQTVMTSLRNAVSPPWDFLLDIGNGGTISVYGTSIDTSPVGAPTAFSNTSYFSDGTHPTHAAHALIATAFAAAVNGLAAAHLNMLGVPVDASGGVTLTASALATLNAIATGVNVTSIAGNGTAPGYLATLATDYHSAIFNAVVSGVSDPVSAIVVDYVAGQDPATYVWNALVANYQASNSFGEWIDTVHDAVVNNGVFLAASQPAYAPAVAGDAMTLTSDYDAAKDAASQTSVNTVSTNISALLTNLTTLIDRVGAFTGTGVNTVLGFLRAMANKAIGISSPSDLTSGGTFVNTTDALEALRDRGDSGAWGGTGGGSGLSGPSSVTLTWHDVDGNPVPNVDFTIVGQGAGRAGSNGIRAFGLEDGDYIVVSRPTGTTLFANYALTVSNTTTATITGTGLNITASADPLTTTAYTTVRYGSGAVAPNVVIHFRLEEGPSGVVDSFSGDVVTGTSDSAGLLQVTLLRSATYSAAWSGNRKTTSLTTGSGTTHHLDPIDGDDKPL